MLDFTRQEYRRLLIALQKSGYMFLTFEEYCRKFVGEPCRQTKKPARFVILRHDVDLKAAHSLKFAEIEQELGIRASYYFRVVPESNQPDIIRAIAAMGHEIGYHYEDLSLTNGNRKKAIASFAEHLTYFRQFYPVSTICMHGAPTSEYDGRDLWKDYDYHEFDVIGEPYFDMDFSDAFYLTDTGRMWDGYKVSVRDKVKEQDRWCQDGLCFHATEQIIRRLEEEAVCKQDNFSPLHHLMITTHPQRWTDSKSEWLKELLIQKAKNIVKRILILSRK